jgi:transposase-like protein
MTIEAALGAEMEHHLGYAKHEQNTQDIDISNNTRNGYYPKTIKGSHGEVEIFVPRDRSSSFETIIIEKQSGLQGQFNRKECIFDLTL